MSETFLPEAKSNIDRRNGWTDEQLEQKTGLKIAALDLLVKAAVKNAQDFRPESEAPRPILIGERHRQAPRVAGFGHEGVSTPSVIELDYKSGA